MIFIMAKQSFMDEQTRDCAYKKFIYHQNLQTHLSSNVMKIDFSLIVCILFKHFENLKIKMYLKLLSSPKTSLRLRFRQVVSGML